MPSPAKRADAERNRDKILAVAKAAFAEPGDEPSMAEVARRAGVGMATLYRNFPGRRELLEALYTDQVDAIVAAAADLAADRLAAAGSDAGRKRPAAAAANQSPEAAFTAWLEHFFAFSAAKRHLAAELLAHVDSAHPIFNDNRTRVLAAARPLLTAAQQAGRIRADLSLEQILDMVIAIAAIQGEPGYSEPILRTLLDGLRTTAAPRRPATPRR